MRYGGELAVEDDYFVLEARYLLVRDDDVAFSLEGADPDRFSINGIARKFANGHFVSNVLEYGYDQYDGEYNAVIALTRVDATGKRCKVEGEWREDDGRSRFWGTLKPLDV